MSPQLSGHGLGIWRGDRCLCRDLDLEVEAGEALQLVGPNGAGKTTLIRVLTGLGRLDEGELRWDGEPIGKAEDYRESLLYVAHHNGLKSHLTARDNIFFYQSLVKYTSQITVDEALGRLGVGELADRPCGLLSMGQRRRVALARLLLGGAKIWFLDEPLTSLDADGVHLVAELLGAHLRGGGMAVVATHQNLSHPGLRLRTLELGRAA